jgi:hypothetical protein
VLNGQAQEQRQAPSQEGEASAPCAYNCMHGCTASNDMVGELMLIIVPGSSLVTLLQLTMWHQLHAFCACSAASCNKFQVLLLHPASAHPTKLA